MKMSLLAIDRAQARQQDEHVVVGRPRTPPAYSRGCGCRKSDLHLHKMSLWLSDKASRRPLTQNSHIKPDFNLFLLDHQVDHETAPHLASCRRMQLFLGPKLSLMTAQHTSVRGNK